MFKILIVLTISADDLQLKQSINPRNWIMIMADIIYKGCIGMQKINLTKAATCQKLGASPLHVDVTNSNIDNHQQKQPSRCPISDGFHGKMI
jgi:hypothetical protein